MSDFTETRPLEVLKRLAPELDASIWGDGVLPAPVRGMLTDHLDGAVPTSPIDIQTIKQGVYRLTFQVDAVTRSVIIKRLAPDVAYRNQMLVTRWLPVVGLEESGPVLLRSAAGADGRRVWHLYEDLGETSLESQSVRSADVERSVRLIATLHVRFAGHAILGECRLWGGDLGMAYYHSNAVDAIRALERIDPDPWRPEHRAARSSILDTLRSMLADEDRRRALQVEHAGPETLLHGDLWPKNILLGPTDRGHLAPRLIDWDHVGVGQIAYDLSTLLSRFPRAERRSVLEIYRRELSSSGWYLPSDAILNQMFDTAERTRIANRVIWPAIEIEHGDHVEWALDHLIELAQWFAQIEPVLP